MLSFFSKQKQQVRKHETKASDEFLKNGAALLEKLVSSSNGRSYDIPIRIFTNKEITREINLMRRAGNCESMFVGLLEDRLVLLVSQEEDVHYGSGDGYMRRYRKSDKVIRDIVITARLSPLNYVLKIVGCCIESQCPSIVYDYPGGTQVLSDLLYLPDDDKALSWRSRLKIAGDIATVVTYLHTAFPTPVIHRGINPQNVIIDQQGGAKMFDFSDSITLPPGKHYVVDYFGGNSFYLDPMYLSSGVVTQKIDVYGLGALLLVLLTGREVHWTDRVNGKYVRKDVLGSLELHRIEEVLDPRILRNEGAMIERGVDQVKAFVNLALRCTEFKEENRPDVTDVARELRRIEKYFRRIC